MNLNARTAPENRRALSRSSPLANLQPMLDQHGLLRVAATDCLKHETKFPKKLPKGHPVTDLLLDWYHRTFRHANNETIVNKVHQKFHIPKLRAQIRSVAKRCQWCCIYKGTPAIPKMSQLPQFRTTSFFRW